MRTRWTHGEVTLGGACVEKEVMKGAGWEDLLEKSERIGSDQ